MSPTTPFDRESLPREMRPFVDDTGRIIRWPARQKTQRLLTEYLAFKFEHGREYAEKDVTFLLLEWHTFGDWALLRRLLHDWGYVDRERDGSRYRLRPRADWPTLPA